MSKKYPGGIIRGTPVVPTTSSAPGIWTVCQAQNYTRQGIWPRSPGAPTIGTATAGNVSATVAFTAPADTGSAAITGYTAISTPGCITGTGASSPITVSGLTNGTAYTFRVRATNGAGTGPISAASNSVTPSIPTGQALYATNGGFSWVAPAGVTSVAVVVVGSGASGGGFNGGGAGGTGAALAYKNNIAVTPGTSYSLVVGAARNGTCGGTQPGIASSFTAGFGTVTAGGGGFSPGTPSGTFDGGGNGGARGNIMGGGGGGAGGYSGNGGAGGNPCQPGTPSAGAGGGGGGGTYFNAFTNGRGGGGVGANGQGSNGTAGGGGGSCGTPSTNRDGGQYGAGGGGSPGCFGGTSGGGVVRIIWPGTTRSFPSTNTGDL